jgi:hypothetical protein
MNMPLALALTIIGIVLLMLGLGSADPIENAFSRLFNGHLTGQTMWLIVGGCLSIAVGLVFCYRNRRA